MIKTKPQQNSWPKKNYFILVVSLLGIVVSLVLLIFSFWSQWQKIKEEVFLAKTIINQTVITNQIDDQAKTHDALEASHAASFLGELIKAITTATTEASLAAEKIMIDSDLN